MPKTACATCEHYRGITSIGGNGRSFIGVCLHKSGPKGKVFPNAYGKEHYPKGCPIDPEPPTPPRQRPQAKRKGRLPVLRNSQLKTSRWEEEPSPQEKRAPNEKEWEV